MAKNTQSTKTSKSSTTLTGNLKVEATRYLYAGAGVADLAVGAVKAGVADVHKRLTGVQKDVTEAQKAAQKNLKPAALRDQAVTVVNTRVEAVTEEAKARRAAVESRVTELQKDAKSFPGKIQAAVDDNVATATKAYTDLAKRGENAVNKLRGLPEVKDAVAEAKTTTAKAKTTRTQAKKATTTTARSAKAGATSTAKTAKTAATRTRKTAAKKAAPARSSAKATTTTAKKTVAKATEAAKAVADNAGTSTAAGTATGTGSTSS